MKNIRVNLIKPTELRYQGAVSMRFIIIVCIAVPLALTLLVSGIKGIRTAQLSADLKNAKDQWQQIEQKYNTAKTEMPRYEKMESLYEDLKEWRPGNAQLSAILLNLQKTVPENIQLVFMDYGLILKKEGETECFLTIDGRSTGKSAEAATTVTRWQQILLEESGFDAIIPVLALSQMPKIGETDDGRIIRQFKLSGQATLGKGKKND